MLAKNRPGKQTCWQMTCQASLLRITIVYVNFYIDYIFYLQDCLKHISSYLNHSCKLPSNHNLNTNPHWDSIWALQQDVENGGYVPPWIRKVKLQRQNKKWLDKFANNVQMIVWQLNAPFPQSFSIAWLFGITLE